MSSPPRHGRIVVRDSSHGRIGGEPRARAWRQQGASLSQRTGPCAAQCIELHAPGSNDAIHHGGIRKMKLITRMTLSGAAIAGLAWAVACGGDSSEVAPTQPSL